MSLIVQASLLNCIPSVWGPGIVHHLVLVEKWAKGWPEPPSKLWDVLTNLTKCRKLAMKKNLFFSSKIWNCQYTKKTLFLVIKPFFQKLKPFKKNLFLKIKSWQPAFRSQFRLLKRVFLLGRRPELFSSVDVAGLSEQTFLHEGGIQGKQYHSNGVHAGTLVCECWLLQRECYQWCSCRNTVLCVSECCDGMRECLEQSFLLKVKRSFRSV